MDFVSEKCNVVSGNDLIDYLYSEKCLPKRSVLISFDDGYRDNFTNAYPILKKLNISAIVFLSAKYINTEKILPHDKDDNPEYNRLLTWSQVKEMSCNDISFGSHALEHVNLAKCSLEKIENEIKESKKLIEDNVDLEVKTISYPFGLFNDFDERTINVTKEAGYILGFTAIYGTNNIRTDHYRLYRIGIEASDTLFTFRAKLNGALDILMFLEVSFIRKAISFLNKLLRV